MQLFDGCSAFLCEGGGKDAKPILREKQPIRQPCLIREVAGGVVVKIRQDGRLEGGDALEFAGGGLLAEAGETVLETAEEAGKVCNAVGGEGGVGGEEVFAGEVVPVGEEVVGNGGGVAVGGGGDAVGADGGVGG